MAKVLMKGNEAIAEAAILAGCRFFFGYPITPQNQIPEYMSKRMPKVGGCFLQAESEVSAINMVYGAAGAGARVMCLGYPDEFIEHAGRGALLERYGLDARSVAGRTLAWLRADGGAVDK